MRLKSGVKINSLQPQMVVGMVVIDSIMDDPRCPEFVITSGCDGQHSIKSRHWTGNAIDMRTRDFSTAELRDEIVAKIRKALPDFDVCLEDTHLHVEYDPVGRP